MNDVEVFRLVDEPARRRELSAVEAAEAFLERAQAWQPRVNAFITLTPELARADARRVDEARTAGRPLPLDGLVMGIKDDVDVAGVRATVGTRFYAERVATQDAEVVRRLRDAGAVIIGKLGLHEWAYGATSNNPHYGAIRNPWDPSRVPGGSSGGSGAAVAADLCVAAIGSDAGGSIRIPAALNGVGGLRPTLASISSRGSHPICYSMETLGPLARSARDLAAVLATIAGYDPGDPSSLEGPLQDPLGGLEEGVRGLRIGLLGGFFREGADPEVERALVAAAEELAGLGAQIGERTLTLAEGAYLASSTVIIRAEALAIHEERLARQPELYGEDVRRRLELGREPSGVEFARATQVVREWRAQVLEAFREVDLLLAPTTLDPAPPIEGAEMIATTQRLARLTYPLSVSGTPAVSVPCGLTDGGLPIGLQLVAAPWRDALALRAAAAYQARTDWHRRRPPQLDGALATAAASAAEA